MTKRFQSLFIVNTSQREEVNLCQVFCLMIFDAWRGGGGRGIRFNLLHILVYTRSFILCILIGWRRYSNFFLNHGKSKYAEHMHFKRHKMGIKSNISSILFHPSKFVYNYILNNFYSKLFWFLKLYMETLETLFFCGLPRRHIFPIWNKCEKSYGRCSLMPVDMRNF